MLSNIVNLSEKTIHLLVSSVFGGDDPSFYKNNRSDILTTFTQEVTLAVLNRLEEVPEADYDRGMDFD